MTDQRESTASRRALLKAAAGCGMMTNTSLLATLLNLQATNALAAGNSGAGGYKALVCLFLLGGNDSYNVLMPTDGNATSGEYGDYHSVRGGYDNGVEGNPFDGGLALEQSTLLPIAGPNGRSFGIHPGMPEIQSLYNGGNADPKFDNKLAFLANVGSLNRPITRTEYNNNTVGARPLGLFSHADHQRHWMTSVPNTRSQVTGWGGKMADLLASTNQNPFVSMNISTNGVNLFQAGDTVVPYTIGLGSSTTGQEGNNPATVVSNYYTDVSTGGNLQNRLFTRNTDSLLGQTFSNLLAQSIADTSRGSIDAAFEFNNAVNAVSLNTPFSTYSLSRRMRVIAKVIGAQSALQQQRQVFFVAIGGWDNHSNLIGAHEVNLPRVSQAIGSFYAAMVELGIENDVTLFTASDFARTLGTNGQGSDHAWGGCQMVVGGCVDGGKIYGDYPTSLLTPNDPTAGDLNLGRGRMIPTTSVDQMSAEMAMWFGIDNGPDLETMLPHIREFYGSGESNSPLQMFLPGA
jgi:uncharacterized protein (DUF1501 family)